MAHGPLVCFALCFSCLILHCSLFFGFFCRFSIVITSLGEERAGLCASRAFVYLYYTR